MPKKQTPTDEPKKKAGRRSDIDWEAIERDYRIGQLSVADVARKHDVALSGLKRKAKLDGWTRDLTPVVQIATKAAITQERADHAKDLAAKAPEIGREIGRSIAKAANSGLDQDVAAAAALGTMRNRVHADIAAALLSAGEAMLREITELCDPGTQGELMDAVGDDDRKAERLRRALSLENRSRTLDTIAAAVGKSVGIDRKANGLDEKDQGGGESIFEDLLKRVHENG